MHEFFFIHQYLAFIIAHWCHPSIPKCRVPLKLRPAAAGRDLQRCHPAAAGFWLKRCSYDCCIRVKSQVIIIKFLRPFRPRRGPIAIVVGFPSILGRLVRVRDKNFRACLPWFCLRAYVYHSKLKTSLIVIYFNQIFLLCPVRY